MSLTTGKTCRRSFAINDQGDRETCGEDAGVLADLVNLGQEDVPLCSPCIGILRGIGAGVENVRNLKVFYDDTEDRLEEQSGMSRQEARALDDERRGLR